MPPTRPTLMNFSRIQIAAVVNTTRTNADAKPRAFEVASVSLGDSLQSISGNEKRVVALFDNGEFDVSDATERALHILSQNPKGFFLMVEWDMHTDNLKAGLNHVIEMDNTIRKIAQSAKKDTLLLFTADHSFDIRLRGGKRGAPLSLEVGGKNKAPDSSMQDIRLEDGHTGEQVLVAAQGPGSERVHGFILNTDLFRIMMAAYGWGK